MKKFAMILALALAFGAAPAWAQAAEPKKEEPKKEEPKKEEPKKEEPKADAVDALKIYRTKGNTWTHKSTMKMSGTETVTYMKYEITEVKDDEATVKMTTMDKDMKETYSSSFPMKLKAEAPKGDAPKGEAPKTVDEKIKVEAGEFECIKTETEAAGIKSTTWVRKSDYLLVKTTSKSESFETTMELVKFEIK